MAFPYNLTLKKTVYIMMDNIACPSCGSIKVIERPFLFPSSFEGEMLGSEAEETAHKIFRCLVCGKEFAGLN